MNTHKEEVESILSGEKQAQTGTQVSLALEARLNEKVARSVEALRGFQPLAAWVLVRIDVATESKGGILLPENKKERPVIGTIVALGPEVNPITLKVGDRVLFGKYAGVEVEMPDGERLTDHRVLRDVECYGRWPAKSAS